MIITIEYQTALYGQGVSTRHNEKMYIDKAMELKDEILSKFPMIKVFLKPLLYDVNDTSIETMFLRRR